MSEMKDVKCQRKMVNEITSNLPMDIVFSFVKDNLKKLTECF